MIGKPEWFRYRIFGWGVAPKTWQGWVYVASLVAIAVVLALLPVDITMHMWLLGGLVVLAMLDTLHVMINLPKVSDERENYHQLLIERNCSFAAIAVLVAAMFYQTWKNTGGFTANSLTGLPFDWWIVAVLGAMLLTKIISTLYLKARG